MRNSKPPPLAIWEPSTQLRLKATPIPNPTTHKGGINATAIDTPGIEVTTPLIGRQIAIAPMAPEKSATPKSNVFGCTRAKISLVASLKGNVKISNMAKLIATEQLKARLAIALANKIKSPAANDKPSERIGPIKGEINIAPIITAGLLSTKPNVAIPAAKMICNQ